MAAEQKEALFYLVKSLTKSEKRQFKLYSGRIGGNADANFMALFNVLEKWSSTMKPSYSKNEY